MLKNKRFLDFFKSLKFRIIVLIFAVSVIPGTLLCVGVLNSYEARALKRQIKMKETDIKVVNDKIKEEREFLKKYIDDKENFYQAVRKIRTKSN